MESQRIDIDEETRGSARERAAWQAYSFVMNAGLWINLSDAGVNGFGEAGSKTAAKKKASYMVLVRMLSAAGICKKEWKEQMYKTVLQ